MLGVTCFVDVILGVTCYLIDVESRSCMPLCCDISSACLKNLKSQYSVRWV